MATARIKNTISGRNNELNSSNEAAVTALVGNCRVKCQWQALAEQFGKSSADYRISREHGLAISTVKAARYYW